MKPEDRFFSEGVSYTGGHLRPESRATCNIFDFDQLRMVKIKGTAKVLPFEADKEIPIFARFADCISPEIRAVTVDDDGLIVGVSTDVEEDDTGFVGYLPFSTIDSLADCPTVKRSELHELDRLAPLVDLVAYEDESGHTRKVVFKFNAMAKPRRAQMQWQEMHVLKSLPPHPNLIPFDRVVLEDVESRIIGFTTKYIPGGTLETPQLPFRFEWLRQLTELVDYLNLELGIMHQDIAPRNLLIDPDTYKPLLFDFDWVASGELGLLEGRDDVSGVVFTLYELITNDTHFTEIPHWERNIDMVQSLPEWICGGRRLDADVATFRNFLNEWVARRNSDGGKDRYLNAPARLTWPVLPTAADYEVPFELGRYENGDPHYVTGFRSRRTALELGQYCFRWERPLQSRLLSKIDNIA